LPGAQIVVQSQDTGISRKLQADSDGHYSVPSLNPGNYRVTVTQQGFKTEVRDGIALTVGREEVVDLSLTVGSVEQSVVVTAAAPLVESTTASLGALVDDQTIRALPLNGRSYDQLALLQPGVTLTSPGPPVGQQFVYGTGKRFSVGGQRPDANLFLMDGADVNDQANGTPGGASGTNLGVDSILEFKIFTNSYKAEYGHSMGSVTTAVTRSGTNQYHGTAFEYIRNHVLDAKNFFDVGNDPPPFIRNQFGGVFGGPIKKDKTFFFVGYEGLRQGLGTTLIATVPTENARQGILPSGNVAVNPVVVPYLNLYPLPNGRDFGDGSAQFISSPTIVTNEDSGMGRLDHQINSKNNIFLRYWLDRDSINAPQSLPNLLQVVSSQRNYATVQWNSIISANAVNNLRFAFDRDNDLNAVVYSPEPDSSLSFVPGEPLGTFQLGAIGASGSRAITPMGPTLGSGPARFTFNNFQTSDDFSYTKGKHSFKTGIDIERVQNNFTSTGQLFGVFTFLTFTSFLQGLPSNLQASAPLGGLFEQGLRQTLFGFYAQDDYIVNSRLTLNIGLRWEAPTSPHDVHGENAVLPTLAFPNTVVEDSFVILSRLNFEPRLGIAWQITDDGKTVLRAGAGIYHNQFLPWAYDNFTKNPPFSGILNATNPAFPGGAAVFEGLPPGASTGLIGLAIMDPVQKTPTNYQYNLSIQREVLKNTMIQVSYEGAHANHLTTEIEGDTPTPVICSTALSNCPAGVPDGAPFYPAGAPRQNPAWAGIRWYQSNGNSEYDGLTVMLRHQSAHGLVGQIFYTFSKSLDDSSGVSPGQSGRSPQSAMNPLDIKGGWSLSDFNSKHDVVGTLTYPLPFRVDSKILGDVINGWRIDAIGTFTSGLPFTPLLATSNSRNLSTAGIADRPNLNPGFSNDPIHGVSAGCAGFPAGTRVGTAANWYDPCAFSRSIPGTYGDLGRNTIIGPGVQDFDMALEKNFNLTEGGVSLTFRAEAFNLLNHANFGLPNTTAIAANGNANPAAGSITYTVTSSRQLQFALRLNF
jgi:hypothetical protein